MKNNKICVYAICKNESKFVKQWLDSMSEADYIVVLDTGSTDDTVELLKKDKRITKVEVKEIKPWRFDIARNESLKLAPEDANILVCTDLDELFETGWARPLRDSWVEGQTSRVSYKYIWSHLENGEPGRIFYYNKIHDKNWIWKYPVHELLWNINTHTENYDNNVSLNLFDKITLHHYPDMTKSRESYLALLEQREQESPEDSYGLIYLSHEYRYQSFYEKSNEKLNKVLNVFGDKIDSLEKASCYLFMGDNFVSLEKFQDAICSYLKGIQAEPTYRELYLNLSKVYITLKDYELAIHYIKLGLKNSFRHYTWLERDISWTYEPYDLLSLAYYYNNQKALSLACACKAFTYLTSDERLKNNIQVIANNIDEKDFLD